MATTTRPAHIAGADLWNCPCRECTALDYRATSVEDRPSSLAAHRAEQFPEVWS